MTEPVSAIRNLGPAFQAACARANIHSAEDVRALGADKTYRRLLETGMKPHFIGYYALAMGLQGRPWNDCKGTEKKALRDRFDRLVADTKPEASATLVADLDALGVRVTSEHLRPIATAPDPKRPHDV